MADDASVYVSWTISALVLIIAAVIAGRRSGRGSLGLLVSPGSGQISLTNFQIVLWTIVILSLISGVFFARLFGSVNEPLGFEIPTELLTVMGISVGSAVTATAIATSTSTPNRTQATEPKLLQAVTSNNSVDVTRFQNFWFTILLVVAYVALAIDFVSGKSLEEITTLPVFEGTLNALLGISHGGYLVGKTLKG